MAKTEFTTSHALRVEKWSAVMFKYGAFRSYFSKFIGPRVRARGVDLATSPNALCQLKMDLKKGKGDKITYPMVAALENAGVTGDNKLEDNEERLTAYDYAVELGKTRNAVRSEGELSDKRVVFDAKMVAKDALGPWLGTRIDKYCLAALSGTASDDGNVSASAPSSNRRWYGGQTSADVLESVANDAAIDSSTNNIFGPAVIEAIKRKARATEPIVRPLMINGKEYYVMFIHPYQSKALKSSTKWINAQQYANWRGEERNPLFTGALGIWDGVIIHEWERVETRLGAGGSTASEYFESGDDCANGIYVARALFCGAQAVVQAWGKQPYFRAETFDYGDEWGVAVGAMVGVGRPEFNSEDYGVITVDTAYVPD
jgi:N4-gp56 family major capsid protein